MGNEVVGKERGRGQEDGGLDPVRAWFFGSGVGGRSRHYAALSLRKRWTSTTATSFFRPTGQVFSFPALISS